MATSNLGITSKIFELAFKAVGALVEAHDQGLFRRLTSGSSEKDNDRGKEREERSRRRLDERGKASRRHRDKREKYARQRANDRDDGHVECRDWASSKPELVGPHPHFDFPRFPRPDTHGEAGGFDSGPTRSLDGEAHDRHRKKEERERQAFEAKEESRREHEKRRSREREQDGRKAEQDHEGRKARERERKADHARDEREKEDRHQAREREEATNRRPQGEQAANQARERGQAERQGAQAKERAQERQRWNAFTQPPPSTGGWRQDDRERYNSWWNKDASQQEQAKRDGFGRKRDGGDSGRRRRH